MGTSLLPASPGRLNSLLSMSGGRIKGLHIHFEAMAGIYLLSLALDFTLPDLAYCNLMEI